jgi:hypothetical protein
MMCLASYFLQTVSTISLHHLTLSLPSVHLLTLIDSTIYVRCSLTPNHTVVVDWSVLRLRIQKVSSLNLGAKIVDISRFASVPQ